MCLGLHQRFVPKPVVFLLLDMHLMRHYTHLFATSTAWKRVVVAVKTEPCALDKLAQRSVTDLKIKMLPD